MKKTLLFIIVLLGLIPTVYGQERTKKVIELKTGISVVGYVMEQEDGSYMLETEGGDIVFYSRDEVNSIVAEKEMPVQTIITKTRQKDLLSRSGLASLSFSESGQDLQPNQVSTVFWKNYESAARKKKAGLGIMIGGGVTILTGSILLSVLKEYHYHTYFNGYQISEQISEDVSPAGLYVIGAGLGIATWGLAKFLRGNSKLKGLANQYNEGHGYSSSFSVDVTPVGISLAYKF